MTKTKSIVALGKVITSHCRKLDRCDIGLAIIYQILPYSSYQKLLPERVLITASHTQQTKVDATTEKSFHLNSEKYNL